MTTQLSDLLKSINKIDVTRERSRRSHLEFQRYTWQYDTIKFISGFHVEKICDRIDKAFDDLRNKKSTFLSVKVPYRHHKSQTVTRSLPPHFLGEFPEGEVIASSYSKDLSNMFSRDSRSIITSPEFKELYPGIELKKDSKSVSEWGITTTKGDAVMTGKTAWVGTGGAITGRGGSLIILDDFLKGRLDAESDNTRNKIWDSFVNDLMTRRADPCIVIVLATPWHVDDIFGRITKAMNKDPLFPKFEELKFPARSKEYPSGYLFPEKFSKDWYESQYATLGSYNASGLLDCDPESRGGNLLKVEQGINWKFVDCKPDGFGALGRGWDIASSEVQTQKDDPDWTIGVKGAIKIQTVRIRDLKEGDEIPDIVHIYIDDIVRIREEAPKRNRIMVNTAIKDTYGCTQFVEAVAGYKDSLTTLKSVLSGVAVVKSGNLPGDKITKASLTIEVPFENGTVYINKNINSEILAEFLKCLKGFPSAIHDDDVDALAIMVGCLKADSSCSKYANSV